MYISTNFSFFGQRSDPTDQHKGVHCFLFYVQKKMDEEILVLYGSQTGSSEEAAIQISDGIPSKLSCDEKKITSRHMQLDDFIQREDCKWPRLVVIVSSSYG